jgi:hypothetical protein
MSEHPGTTTPPDDPRPQKKKKKKRCLACRTRLPTLSFTCSGCGRGPLCLTCVTPEKHACAHDWRTSYQERLRKENELVRASTLRDTL